MVDPNDPRVTTTKGAPAPGTPAGGAPEPINPATGQHGAYWVLTEEERGKGFVRPVRDTYIHRGIRPKHPTRVLTDEEKERFGDDFVVFEPYPDAEETGTTGRYWTRVQLESGCGTETSMSPPLAETYAREPTFYASTFCTSCRAHFPVDQFRWKGTDEAVGS